jgi:nitroreductase
MGDTLTDIRERRSVRKYKAAQVKEDELQTVLTAGTWAASGQGKQAGLIVVVQDKDTINAVQSLNAAVLGNPKAATFFGAPTLIVVFADTTVHTWLDDGNLIIGNMMLAAQAIGLASCYVFRAREVFDTPEGKAFKAKWGVDDRFRGVGNLVLGYGDEKPAPKPRKDGYIIRVRA